MLGRFFPGFSSRSWRRQGEEDRPSVKDSTRRGAHQKDAERPTHRDHGRHTIDRIRHFLGRPARVLPPSPPQDSGSGWYQWQRLSRALAQRMDAAEQALAAKPKPDARTLASCLREVREVRMHYLREIGRLAEGAGRSAPLTDSAQQWLSRLDSLVVELQIAAFVAATDQGHGMTDEALHDLVRWASQVAHAEAARPYCPPDAEEEARVAWASICACLGMREWVLHLPSDGAQLDPSEFARTRARLKIARRMRHMFLSSVGRPPSRDGVLMLSPSAGKWLTRVNRVEAHLRARVFAQESACRYLLPPENLHALAARVAFIRRLSSESRYRPLDHAEIDKLGAARVFIAEAIEKCRARLPDLRIEGTPEYREAQLKAMESELSALEAEVRKALARIDRDT